MLDQTHLVRSECFRKFLCFCIFHRGGHGSVEGDEEGEGGDEEGEGDDEEGQACCEGDDAQCSIKLYIYIFQKSF